MAISLHLWSLHFLAFLPSETCFLVEKNERLFFRIDWRLLRKLCLPLSSWKDFETLARVQCLEYWNVSEKGASAFLRSLEQDMLMAMWVVRTPRTACLLLTNHLFPVPSAQQFLPFLTGAWHLFHCEVANPKRSQPAFLFLLFSITCHMPPWAKCCRNPTESS